MKAQSYLLDVQEQTSLIIVHQASVGDQFDVLFMYIDVYALLNVYMWIKA